MDATCASALDESYPSISPGSMTANGLLIEHEVDTVFPAQLKETAHYDSKITYANYFVATYNVGSLHRSRRQLTRRRCARKNIYVDKPKRMESLA